MQFDKPAQFILMVQTGLVTKYVSDPSDGSAPMCRPIWAVGHMEEAFAAAERIPSNITARKAAEAFIRWVFDAPREPGDDEILQTILRE